MEQFGRYLLERRLAVGGMGEVYLARHSGVAGFAKQLVVKRIKASLVDEPQFVEMFLNEGCVAALLDHPNIVHIYELGQVEGTYFIAMEYVPGCSLATLLERLGGPLELPYALYTLASLCEGLAYAHDAVGLDGQPLNLVHRDINPANVLFGYSGSVKLSDFGVAKVARHETTAVGMLKGKCGYLSPEQARGESLDRRSDIFALGLVLFEMTLGRRANRAPAETAMVLKAAKREIPAPSEIDPHYPEELEHIFERATAFDPAERYQDVKALHEDLLAFQLESRLVVTASRVGEWLRQIVPPAEEESAQDATALAFQPTQAAGGQATLPLALEVDMAKERAVPFAAHPVATRGRSRGLLTLLFALLVLGAAVSLLARHWPAESPRAIAASPLQADARPADSAVTPLALREQLAPPDARTQAPVDVATPVPQGSRGGAQIEDAEVLEHDPLVPPPEPMPTLPDSGPVLSPVGPDVLDAMAGPTSLPSGG